MQQQRFRICYLVIEKKRRMSYQHCTGALRNPLIPTFHCDGHQEPPHLKKAVLLSSLFGE